MTRQERIAAIKHWRGCEMLEQPFFSIRCGSTAMDTTSFGEIIDFLIDEIDKVNERNEGLNEELRDQQKYVLHLERNRSIDCNSSGSR
jgi:hypothetical protein